jgi:aldose sugar dehydrogenase
VQPKNLGGKVLRVDRDGNAAKGNLGGEFDSRIYSYGHRNTQGLTFFFKPREGEPVGVSVEHGPGIDDEVNLLKSGNFGWAPPPAGYDEGVPMTDKSRYPDAVEAIWSSGKPTQAPSGAGFLKGTRWKGWDGALAVAFLKDQKVTIMHLDKKTYKVTKEEVLFKNQFGRIRAAKQGPDGNLYIGTSKGEGDQIIRVIPD